MKKHGFLFYLLLWPFLLIFTLYKYIFIGLSHLIEYVVCHITDSHVNHPFCFSKPICNIKELIFYCYNRSVIISRIMYISLLALNILFAGFIFNYCETALQYVIASLLFICTFTITIIIASCIFRVIDKLLTRSKCNAIEVSEADNSNINDIDVSGEKNANVINEESLQAECSPIYEHQDTIGDVKDSCIPQFENTISSSKQLKDAHDKNDYSNKVQQISSNDLFNIHINVANSPASEESMRFPKNASYTISFESLCKYIVKKGDATVSMLQTTFGITFFDASDLFSKLEDYKIVGHDCPPLPRTVLISLDELSAFFSNNIISDEDKNKVYKTTSPIIYDIVESDEGFQLQLKNYNQNNSMPYWKQTRNTARMQFEESNLDLTDVTIFFHNGIICRIVPDVQSYYSARYYIINGAFFDTYSLEAVKSIPIPSFNENYGTPVYNLEYLLKMRASQERDNKNYELSYALMYKAIEGMNASKLSYTQKDYMQFIMWLYKDGKIDEAIMLENRLRRENPETFDKNLFKKNDFLSKIEECVSADTDYIYCSGHINTCCECAKYQNRVYCISGNDVSFPKLPDYVYEYGGFHSGCRHSFYPYLGGYITDKNGNFVDALEYSNRPFIDDRTPEEIQAYKQYLEKTKAEQQRDENLKAFYILRKELPDIMPKSYSTFMKYKSKNSAEYKLIINSAKEKGITSV